LISFRAKHPVFAIAKRPHLTVQDPRRNEVVHEHGIRVSVGEKVPGLSIGLTVAQKFKAVEREPVTAFH
jgi:hypothetical protein